MPQKKFPIIDVYDRQTLRTSHCDDMELLAAASEVESFCAGWLVDQRIYTQRSAP